MTRERKSEFFFLERSTLIYCPDSHRGTLGVVELCSHKDPEVAGPIFTPTWFVSVRTWLNRLRVDCETKKTIKTIQPPHTQSTPRGIFLFSTSLEPLCTDLFNNNTTISSCIYLIASAGELVAWPCILFCIPVHLTCLKLGPKLPVITDITCTCRTFHSCAF